MSKEKLKPCPFCGNIPFSGPSEGSSGSWDIDCSTKQGQCFIPINNFPFKTKAEAIEAWNKRAGIAELESQLAAYHEAEKIVTDPPHDQECCGCVAILRKQLAEIEDWAVGDFNESLLRFIKAIRERQ